MPSIHSRALGVAKLLIYFNKSEFAKTITGAPNTVEEISRIYLLRYETRPMPPVNFFSHTNAPKRAQTFANVLKRAHFVVDRPQNSRSWTVKVRGTKHIISRLTTRVCLLSLHQTPHLLLHPPARRHPRVSLLSHTRACDLTPYRLRIITLIPPRKSFARDVYSTRFVSTPPLLLFSLPPLYVEK